MRNPCKTIYVRRGEEIMVCSCHYGCRPNILQRGRVKRIWAETTA